MASKNQRKKIAELYDLSKSMTSKMSSLIQSSEEESTSSDLEEQGTLSSASVDSDAPDDNAGSKPKRAKATLKESHKLAKSIKPSSKKGKGANTKRSTKQPAKKANAIVDIEFCAMGSKDGGFTYKQESGWIIVELNRNDSYEDVAYKAAKSCNVINPTDAVIMTSQLILLKFSGAIISNSNITIGRTTKNWTIGGYLSKCKKGADSVKLGVGLKVEQGKPGEKSDHRDEKDGAHAGSGEKSEKDGAGALRETEIGHGVDTIAKEVTLVSGFTYSPQHTSFDDGHQLAYGTSQSHKSVTVDSSEDFTIATSSASGMQFSVEELNAATDNWSTMLGEGAYGAVFLGRDLLGVGTMCAVKKLNKQGEKAVKSDKPVDSTGMSEGAVGNSPIEQLQTEVTALTKYRHQNLVSLMGYSCSQDLKAIVYEYCENNSLFYHLHKNEQSPLTWSQRVSILQDTCKGLSYLHGSNPPLVHQDIKSLNILLDGHFTAKLGDFGFAIQMPQHIAGKTVVTALALAHSDGYGPPELLSRRYSPKSDVYAYGVVVLETFTGLLAFDKSREDAELVMHCEDKFSKEADFVSLADKKAGKIPQEFVATFLYIVQQCTTRRRKSRPTSADVMKMWLP